MSEPNNVPPEPAAESEEETARKEAEMLAKLREFEAQLVAAKRQEHDPVLAAFSQTVAALEQLDKGQRVRVLRAVSVLLQVGGSE